MEESSAEQTCEGVDVAGAASVQAGCHGEATALPFTCNTVSCQLEVRWLLSGELAAAISCPPSMRCLGDLKEELCRLLGVPICDQRLFVNDYELSDEAVPLCELGSSLRLLQCTIDPRETNLSHFHVPLAFDALPEGQFALVRKVASGIHAGIFLYRWCREDAAAKDVVVKMMWERTLECFQNSAEHCDKNLHLGRRMSGREAGRIGAREVEDPLTEIGVLSYLAAQPDLPLYLMKCEAVFAEGQRTWLVTEYADGGELLNVAASGRPLAEPEVKQYTWQILRAVEYLHRHNISHRDVSLENILLKRGAIRLMDFGMAAQSRSASGKPFRYFRSVGKNFYRAPECYVPALGDCRVTPRPGDKGGDVAMLRTAGNYFCEMKLPPIAKPHHNCMAQVWGYTAEPTDVFASGICVFILTFQTAPWNQAIVNDQYFSYFLRHQDSGVTSLARKRNKRLPSAEASQLVCDMLRPYPALRPSASQCLSAPWFAELSSNPVPSHQP